MKGVTDSVWEFASHRLEALVQWFARWTFNLKVSGSRPGVRSSKVRRLVGPKKLFSVLSVYQKRFNFHPC